MRLGSGTGSQPSLGSLDGRGGAGGSGSAGRSGGGGSARPGRRNWARRKEMIRRRAGSERARCSTEQTPRFSFACSASDASNSE